MELKIIPIFQVIIAMVLMTLLQYLFPDFTFINSTTTSLAIIMLALALLIGFFAIYSFRKHDTTVNPTTPEESSQVVDSGIYQFSRNPMYLAMLLALVAYACYLQSPLNVAVCLVFIWYITKYQITPEERMLTKLFGQQYSDYQSRVRRWL